MKILAYGVRDDEMPYLEEWQKQNPDVEVKAVPELITDETVEWAKGYDGLMFTNNFHTRTRSLKS